MIIILLQFEVCFVLHEFVLLSDIHELCFIFFSDIVSRASAALDGHNIDAQIEHDLISNDDMHESTEYTNCHNSEKANRIPSQENLNLTVYF